MKYFKGSSVNVIEWTSQSPDFNPNKCLRRDLNMSVHQGSPIYLKKLVTSQKFVKSKGLKRFPTPL